MQGQVYSNSAALAHAAASRLAGVLARVPDLLLHVEEQAGDPATVAELLGELLLDLARAEAAEVRLAALAPAELARYRVREDELWARWSELVEDVFEEVAEELCRHPEQVTRDLASRLAAAA